MTHPSTILVIRTGALGDLVLILPLLHVIRETFPEARLEVMTHPHYFSLVTGPDLAHAAVNADLKGIHTFFSPAAEPDRYAVDYFSRFDWVVSIRHDPDKIFEMNLKRAGVREVLTIAPLPPEGFTGHYQDHLFSHFHSEWESDQRALFGAILTRRKKLGKDPVRPRISGYGEVDEQIRHVENSQKIRGFLDQKFLTIHPGSGSRYKNWPLENFRGLMEQIIRTTDFNVLLLSGPAEGARDPRFKMLNTRTWIAENLPIPILSSILRKSRCHVGNDSGVSHLAAAVNCPTICLFGPTSSAVWKPVGERVGVVAHATECSPCRKEDLTSCTHHECLMAIQMEQVLSLILCFSSGM